MAAKIPLGRDGGLVAERIGRSIQQFGFFVFDGLVLLFVNSNGGVPFVSAHVDAVANDAGIACQVIFRRFNKIG